jgi:hypothetical protein
MTLGRSVEEMEKGFTFVDRVGLKQIKDGKFVPDGRIDVDKGSEASFWGHPLRSALSHVGGKGGKTV